MGAFGEGDPQGRVSSARAPGAALAGAGVVAGRDAGPGAEMARLAKGLQVGSELGEDGAGTAKVDAGNRLQPPDQVQSRASTQGGGRGSAGAVSADGVLVGTRAGQGAPPGPVLAHPPR